MQKIRYPIGVQSFEGLIKDGYTYVDKTDYIRRLVEDGKIFFLGRPRRFGKSLFLSTLHAFFEGKRELFKGLAIDSWDEWDWEEYPVIHIDLNAKNYTYKESLQERINAQLIDYEATYDVTAPDTSIDGRFGAIIKKAYEMTGRRVAVLIDEYDKPILDNLHDDTMLEMHRDSLRAFYSVLKSSDQYIRFIFLTGVTKFGQLNVFSGLNNISDISLLNEYSGICGITESELRKYFDSGVRRCAEEWECTVEEAYGQLKHYYDGYHFSGRAVDIYNPWSLLSALRDRELTYYWNATGGTMSMLYNLIRSNRLQLRDLDGERCSIDDLMGKYVNVTDAVPMLYQTGYLTIGSYERDSRLVTLRYPNYEVKRGFLKAMLPEYTGTLERVVGVSIEDMVADVRRGDIDGLLERMQTFFAGFPYENALKTEKDFQTVMYCVMTLLGLRVNVEQHSALGSADMVIQTDSYVCVVEFKVDKTPQDALRQIEEKGYAAPFAKDPRELIKVGVSFSLSDRNITAWDIRRPAGM